MSPGTGTFTLGLEVTQAGSFLLSLPACLGTWLVMERQGGARKGGCSTQRLLFYLETLYKGPVWGWVVTPDVTCSGDTGGLQREDHPRAFV